MQPDSRERNCQERSNSLGGKSKKKVSCRNRAIFLTEQVEYLQAGVVGDPGEEPHEAEGDEVCAERCGEPGGEQDHVGEEGGGEATVLVANPPEELEKETR